MYHCYKSFVDTFYSGFQTEDLYELVRKNRDLFAVTHCKCKSCPYRPALHVVFPHISTRLSVCLSRFVSLDTLRLTSLLIAVTEMVGDNQQP